MSCLTYFISILVSLISVHSAELSSFHSWQSDGPKGLEHGVSWTHSNNFYVTHGYSFIPFQGTQSLKTWSLDFNSMEWTELPLLGDIPTGNGRGAKRGDRNQVLMLSKEHAFFGSREITQLSLLTIENNFAKWKKLSILATTEEEANIATTFLLRDSQLSSLVYSKKDDSFYTLCNKDNCDVFEIKIFGDQAKVNLIKAKGETPSARIGFAYGYSQQLNTFVMVSGQKTSPGSSTPFSEKIWTLNLNTMVWESQLLPFSGRRNPCFVFDEGQQELVVWGGTSNGSTSFNHVEIYNLKTQSFKTISENTNKSRSSCFGAYDESNKRILFGFGNGLDQSGLIIHQDLWTIKNQ